MKSMPHHSSCITIGSEFNIVALHGEMTSLDMRIEGQLRTLTPGRVLTEDIVLKVADYCQDVRFLDRNDTERTHRWKRRRTNELIPADLGTTGGAA